MVADYARCAKEILDTVGGRANLVSAAHCATRLRLVTVDNSRIDILEEAVRYGIYVLVTSEFKVKKMTRSKFIEMLLASREVLILGNIKDQLLFSYTGVREENRKVEFGYYHNAGVNRKVKLIFHREMK